jgi:PAS domain S-box-containing protein
MPDDPGRESGAEERYRQLLDAAPDAMLVVGAGGKIEFANLQAERLFGYTREELIGAPFDLLIPERFRSAHEDHVRRFRANPNTRAMGSGLDLSGRHRDGRDIPVEVSLSPVRSAQGISVCASIRDITERRQIEAAAKLSADRLASAVETIEDAVALFDASDRLVLCNSVYRDLLGEATGPLIGKSYEELIDVWMRDLAFASDEERARFREERLAGRRDPKGAFEVHTRDGRTLRVMDRRTVEGGIVKTIWDLTHDVRIAAELREARSSAEAASAAKSEFLSSMSHELRTPLNAILGFAQLLERDRKEPLSARHKERAGQILRGGEHLLRLIDDILDLSRIEAGRVSISKEPVAVHEVLEQARRTLEPMAVRASVRLEMAPVAPGIPNVVADRTRFAQIVMNFGSNAIKYNRPGGAVALSASHQESAIRVTVSDTGIGIPEDKHSKIFQPFQRAGQETGPIEGTGIGLVISKRLAELMAGRVGFRSTPGVGSEFWVELPAQPAAAAQPSNSNSPAESTPRLEGHAGRLILYVEDNPANVAFMRDVLGDFEGIELACVPTAEMGVALARARHPDVVIMDINLPGMSGLEALGVLRSTPETSTLPVIALTAAASDRDRRRGIEAGFFRYLTKPVKVDELVSALEALLSAAD